VTTIRTNASALTAAQLLNAASSDLQATSERVSTGLKVSSARDNGAAFAVAQKMRAGISGWEAANSSLARGQSLADTAASATAEIASLLGELRRQVVAFRDPSLDATSRKLLQEAIQTLIAHIDKTAKVTAFDGKRPLADTLTTTNVTTNANTYTIPTSPLTPPSLAGGIQNTSGAASQTFTRDAGATPGRLDLFLEAYGVPDVLEIWQGSTRVAATGQPYVPGGAGVGPGAAVSGQSVLSFDYDPANGQTLEFRFNENVSALGSAWNVGGVALQDPATPVPTPTVVSTTTPVTTSTATTYQFIRSSNGETEDLSARPLTANALGLDSIDWNDPSPLLGIVDAAIATANDAAAYFGERQQAFASIQAQNAGLLDALQVGVGNLVDADVGKEAAKLQADQTRQQLASQSLGIANAGARWLLGLLGKAD